MQTIVSVFDLETEKSIVHRQRLQVLFGIPIDKHVVGYSRIWNVYEIITKVSFQR